jgi:hypothetical protein
MTTETLAETSDKYQSTRPISESQSFAYLRLIRIGNILLFTGERGVNKKYNVKSAILNDFLFDIAKKNGMKAWHKL